MTRRSTSLTPPQHLAAIFAAQHDAAELAVAILYHTGYTDGALATW